MREENKRVYYVAKPSKTEDEYGAAFNNGYGNIAMYCDLVSDRRGESDEIAKFGAYDTQKMFIVHDDNDGATPDIALGDGVWLDELPTGYTLESTSIDHPQYTVERVQSFRTKHSYTLTKAVDQNASNG